MKTIKEKTILFIMILTFGINVGLKTAKEYAVLLKDKRYRSSLVAKGAVIIILCVITFLFKLIKETFNWYETYAVITGLFPFILIFTMLIFDVRPASSLDRIDNEKVYNILAMSWMYPVAIVFAAIDITLKSFLPALIVSAFIFCVKFYINSSIKNKLIEYNERYLHTGF